METGILRPLTEILFTFFPMVGTLQWFDWVAALLNALVGVFGLDIRFVGL